MRFENPAFLGWECTFWQGTVPEKPAGYCLLMAVQMTFRLVPGRICSAWVHTLMATGIAHIRTILPRGSHSY